MYDMMFYNISLTLRMMYNTMIQRLILYNNKPLYITYNTLKFPKKLYIKVVLSDGIVTYISKQSQ